MILRAAWVVPVSSPPIRDGYVEISGDRIVAVGRWADRSGPAAQMLDLSDAILTPGLVNPHTHLELTCYAGQIPPGPFWSWIAKLVQLRRQPGQIGAVQVRGPNVFSGYWRQREVRLDSCLTTIVHPHSGERVNLSPDSIRILRANSLTGPIF